MRYAHKIVFTFFAKPGDDVTRLRAALAGLAPSDETKRKKALSESVAAPEGQFEDELRILACTLTGESETTAMLRRILASLAKADYAAVSQQRESRLDDELDFFLRLDKKKFLAGMWALTQSGDCLHVRITLAAYPKTKASALAVLDKIFKDLSPTG